MSNKTKVIIITRIDEYVKTNMTSMPGREFFGNPILEQIFNIKAISKPSIDSEEIPTPSINSLGPSVKKFLAVMDTANKKYKEYKEKSQNNEEEWIWFFHDEFDYEVDEKEDGIQAMLDNPNEKVTAAIEETEENESHQAIKDNKCYAVISDKEYEIYLLLWDQLGRDSSEKVVPFGSFIKQVCKDCNITNTKDDGNTNNLLYVHDCQLIGVQQDKTVFIRNKNFKSPFKNEDYYSILTDFFDYAATFGHLAFDGTFQNYILKCKFGPTHVDTIALQEAEAENLPDLRNKSVKIIK